MQVKRHTNQKGQVLIEWVIWGSCVFLIWKGSFELAKTLLKKDTLETTSVVAARRYLSKQLVSAPNIMNCKPLYHRQKDSGHSLCTQENSKSQYQIKIPQKTQGLSWLDWF